MMSQKDLNMAIILGDERFALRLVDEVATLDLQTEYGTTALIMACSKKLEKVALRLIDKGANLDLQIKYGYTALIYACERKLEQVALRIVEKGANLDLQNEGGLTALMYACSNKLEQVALCIVEKSANLDLQDIDGWTALMIACSTGSLACVKICYVAGARTDLRTKDKDQDALDLAVEKGHRDVVDFLEFVLKSDFAQVLLKEVKVSRKPLLSLYENGLIYGWGKSVRSVYGALKQGLCLSSCTGRFTVHTRQVVPSAEQKKWILFLENFEFVNLVSAHMYPG